MKNLSFIGYTLCAIALGMSLLGLGVFGFSPTFVICVLVNVFCMWANWNSMRTMNRVESERTAPTTSSPIKLQTYAIEDWMKFVRMRPWIGTDVVAMEGSSDGSTWLMMESFEVREMVARHRVVNPIPLTNVVSVERSE